MTWPLKLCLGDSAQDWQEIQCLGCKCNPDLRIWSGRIVLIQRHSHAHGISDPVYDLAGLFIKRKCMNPVYSFEGSFGALIVVAAW